MNTIIVSCIFLLSPILIILLFKRLKFVRKIGTVIVAYAIGILLALFWTFTDTIPVDGEPIFKIQNMLQNITVIIAIPLLLFNSDFKLWTKTLPKTFKALLGGLIAIVFAVFISFFIFKNSSIDNIVNVSAMMTGIYTGGTMNFYALGKALSVDETTIVIVLTFQMIVTFPFILFITAGGYKFFRKILPFRDVNISQVEAPDTQSIEADSFEQYNGMFKKENFFKMLLGLLLSLCFVGVGVGISLLISHKMNELIIILTITTLAIIASFFDKIRNLPKTFELGMFFILIFSVVVASKFNIAAIDSSVIQIMLFVMCIMLFSIAIHLLMCRLFKVDGDLFTVAIVGMFCSPPFIPPVVSAMKNKKVLISGITIGLVGYAVGTYLGLLLSILLPVFL